MSADRPDDPGPASARKRSPPRSEELEARFGIISFGSDEIFSESDDEGRYIWASANVERLLGVTREQILGRRFEEFIHPDDLRRLGEPRPSQGHRTDRVVFRVRGPHSRWRWVESRGVFYELPGGERRLLGFTRDVTGTREEAARFELLGERGRDLVTELDDRGRISYASPNHERLLGLRVEALVGVRALDMIHPEETGPIEELLAQGQPGRSLETRFRLQDGDARWRWMETIITSYRGTNDEARFLCLCRDVTAQIESHDALLAARARSEDLARRLEVAAERERAEIARNVHDDLGQGLTGLQLGISATLAGLEMPDDLRERLVRMDDEIGSLLESLRRISAKLHPAALELGLAAAIESQARELASVAGWDLSIDLDEEGLPHDRDRDASIFRIAEEALTNVARHAAARNVQLRMYVDKHALHLEIRDDGRGDHDKPGGSGLIGMQERALAWGGRLEVQARAGHGTRVWLKLPLPQDDEDAV